VKSNHAIRFAAAGTGRLAPLAARTALEFNDYFRTLWQELDVHVDH
jgi:NitT/TauT family transport system ATP-binding protein